MAISTSAELLESAAQVSGHRPAVARWVLAAFGETGLGYLVKVALVGAFVPAEDWWAIVAIWFQFVVAARAFGGLSDPLEQVESAFLEDVGTVQTAAKAILGMRLNHETLPWAEMPPGLELLMCPKAGELRRAYCCLRVPVPVPVPKSEAQRRYDYEKPCG